MDRDIRLDVHKSDTRFSVTGTSMLPTLKTGDAVLLTRVRVDDLIPGDCVLINNGDRAYVHRFLWRNKKSVITKGDGHRIFDPVWQNSAIRGQMIQAWRDDKCIYKRTAQSIQSDRWKAYKHLLTGAVWTLLHRMKTWLVAFIIILCIPSIVLSSVTLAHFEVDPGDTEIYIYWETASEAGNLGFYLWRSENPTNGFYKLPISDTNLQFIPSTDDGAGSFYEYVDAEVTAGVTYYYKVQDVPDTGAEGAYSETLSGEISLVQDTDTPTPTLTPSLTPTPTPTNNPSLPYVRFWTEKDTLPAGECTTLQWQTDNVTSVFLDGDGVPGTGAKTFCPCQDEIHTLTVYYNDNTRYDFTQELVVTGSCNGALTSPLLTPTPGATSRSTATREVDIPTETLTPQPMQTLDQTLDRQPRTPTATRVFDSRLTLTLTPQTLPTTVSQEGVVSDAASTTATVTRVIIEGQPTRQPKFFQNYYLVILASLTGLVLIGAGLWLWKGR